MKKIKKILCLRLRDSSSFWVSDGCGSDGGGGCNDSSGNSGGGGGSDGPEVEIVGIETVVGPGTFVLSSRRSSSFIFAFNTATSFVVLKQ